MSQQRFYYQPSGLSAVIIWSWVAIFLFGGIIFQYEMAKFNWPAIIIAIIFVLFLTWQLVGRQLLINDETLMVRRLLAPRALTVKLNQLEQVRISGHTLTFYVHGRRFAYRLSKRALARLSEQL
ncbi:EbsA family protein [Furfurilactobacillus curtus]|uniref:Pore-forming protein n=1 Tax=Furfurilactobacillus curtus TaxID=1746200 RepID=A0ABQ5JKY7_9LACO